MSAQKMIEAQAASWLVKQDEPGWSADEQQALDGWLAKSADHLAAYWRLEHGWSCVGAAAAPVQDLDWWDDEASAPKRRWLPMALAASLVAMVGIYAQFPGTDGSGPVIAEQRFDTGRGERKIASLSDGSKIELNSGSTLRAAIGDGTREVWLDKGEAYFSIAKRDGQRFIVHAGYRTITVLGTKFNVRRESGRLVLSVIEGRVSLADSKTDDNGRAVIVTGGDMAVADGASTVVTADLGDKVSEAVSWRDGVLTFDQSTLAEAAAEFNRYNEKSIMITDAAAAEIRIGGSFKWNNVDAFARLMREAYGLRVQDDGVTIKISSR